MGNPYRHASWKEAIQACMDHAREAESLGDRYAHSDPRWARHLWAVAGDWYGEAARRALEARGHDGWY